MAAMEYRTVLVAGSCEPDDGDMRYMPQAAGQVSWVPELSRSVRPWRNVKALWSLWRLLRRERPTIVHSHTAMAGCLGRLAAVLSGAPIIVHTFHGNSLSEYFSLIQARVFCRIEQLLAYFTDALCVVSPQQATELSAEFHVAPAYKFHVVPLGLDLDDYFALRPPADNGPLTVGWFGRMVPVKNIALLAATIEKTLQHSPEIRFVIAGDGPDRSALNGLLDRYADRVECLGGRTRSCRRWPAATLCCRLRATKARQWRSSKEWRRPARLSRRPWAAWWTWFRAEPSGLSAARVGTPTAY
jgi:glycosyltransferase involved in cell wall biosynthesis